MKDTSRGAAAPGEMQLRSLHAGSVFMKDWSTPQGEYNVQALKQIY